ncbi:hypothetical protein M409DRAFT_55381 [Zasmidium cellare ATCC 36951]|uniref:NADP-dependent oxidoreductase domain-containing protein n=1 Tax=Zasmidium cellare ATCC 36951 TaxID=1080233 RepID=A0A6A6CFQ0_ZASCE|nr:uncharacterized protein M409DRAFT_55381 [Zasmidium cellare ATCC 36951]KAF2166034.1 hypothetical protein M409DRAFT_55381 [Zasmidium cellare ATCC 36951]
MAQHKEVKMAHVNLMADTVIANLPEEALRSVLRSMLATDPSITSTFEDRSRDYLRKTSRKRFGFWESSSDGLIPTKELQTAQQRMRSMLGCGMCYEAVPILTDIIKDVARHNNVLSPQLTKLLSALDGDIVQTVTAVQKTLLSSSGTRLFSTEERASLVQLHDSMQHLQSISSNDFIFERSFTALTGLLSGGDSSSGRPNSTHEASFKVPAIPASIETFSLNNIPLPRLFSGLWQLSSPSWGVASTKQIQEHFQAHVSQGFVAYDMADHYGDAEIVFGNFRASCTNPDSIFGATKYCIFSPITVTREVITANVLERCQRMRSDHVDLLQFHWQFYNDKQDIQALKYLQEDSRVRQLGLCNFDTERLEEIVQAGIKIHTNQVQFSLIDSRPVFKMGAACEKHNIKLLTYGTLCGGFIAEKWLAQPEPELFHGGITPSQRKYYEMIVNWGGWDLFQELLHTLKKIAEKHNVTISNVAARWVLDFPYVGAVIVGTRMGVSEHAKENLATYGWRLDDADQGAIGDILERSRRKQLIDLLGDCGGEYR